MTSLPTKNLFSLALSLSVTHMHTSLVQYASYATYYLSIICKEGIKNASDSQRTAFIYVNSINKSIKCMRSTTLLIYWLLRQKSAQRKHVFSRNFTHHKFSEFSPTKRNINNECKMM